MRSILMQVFWIVAGLVVLLALALFLQPPQVGGQ